MRICEREIKNQRSVPRQKKQKCLRVESLTRTHTSTLYTHSHTLAGANKRRVTKITREIFAKIHEIRQSFRFGQGIFFN